MSTRIKLLATTLFAVASISASGPALATCACQCVNGQVEAICSSTIEMRPICPPRICPIVPPAIRPISPPTLPPLGTTECQPQQVWNQFTGRYEWRRLCH